MTDMPTAAEVRDAWGGVLDGNSDDTVLSPAFHLGSISILVALYGSPKHQQSLDIIGDALTELDHAKNRLWWVDALPREPEPVMIATEDAARIWDEGHATDEHGRGLCECRNPYRKYPCPELGCIKSVEHPKDRHIDEEGRRWWATVHSNGGGE
jgi:hypothetical protein